VNIVQYPITQYQYHSNPSSDCPVKHSWKVLAAAVADWWQKIATVQLTQK